MKYFVNQVGFTPSRLTIDGFMICAIVLITCYFTSSVEYKMIDIVEAVLCSFVSMGGTISLTTAL